ARVTVSQVGFVPWRSSRATAGCDVPRRSASCACVIPAVCRAWRRSVAEVIAEKITQQIYISSNIRTGARMRAPAGGCMHPPAAGSHATLPHTLASNELGPHDLGPRIEDPLRPFRGRTADRRALAGVGDFSPSD